jgi:GNAT superfamily N-acetyltransferase
VTDAPGRQATPSLGSLSQADCELAAQVLARAFRDNPLNRAVIGSRDPSRRERTNVYGLRAVLPVARRHGLALAARRSGVLVAALVATAPHYYPLPAPPLWARARTLLGQGLRVSGRWAEVFRALDAAHPPEPHWYLGTLGVDPKLQGCGVGTALLCHWLERVDADSRPAYLETDRPENLAFYGRRGFETCQELEVLGAPIWCMRREASAAASR